MPGDRITAGCRVSGRFGELIDPPGGPGALNANGKRKRRVRQIVYGTVVSSCGLRKWGVRFDHSGEIKNDISSNQLKVVNSTEGVPINAAITVSLIEIFYTVYYFKIANKLTNIVIYFQDEQEEERAAGNVEPANLDNVVEAEDGDSDLDEDDDGNVDFLLDFPHDFNDDLLDHDNEGAEQENEGAEQENEGANPAGLFSDFQDQPEAATNQAHEDRYQRKFCLAWDHIRRLKGKNVVVGRGADEIKWEVVDEVDECVIPPDGFCGVKPEYGFDKLSLADALLLLWPGDFHEQLRVFNKILRDVINVDREKITGRQRR